MIDPHTPPLCDTCADIRWLDDETPCPDCNPEGDDDDPI